MPDPTHSASPPGDPLDAVIAQYLEQVEAKEVPDREALLARYLDLADRLRAFFADYDQIDRQAADLRLSPDPNRTIDATPPAGDFPRIRYFGDYELVEVIAHGGMGVVYKARQVSLNRVVALKMILRGELATPRDVARFQAEAEAAANLDHPHIVPIYEVGECDGQQYYAMRYIEGAPLTRRPRADARQEAALVATVARAVHHAHVRGILHRDLKPSNILVDPAGTPFVADFGLAKRVDADRSLTESGALVGTPRYMAPEQAAGRKDLTVGADVYSLGVVLYERLTGQTPFTGETVLSILRQVRETEPPRPSSLTPGLNRDLETVCLKCLEKDPAKRYGSAEALAEELERFLRGEPIRARPVGQAERMWRWCRRNPVVAGLSTGLAVALVAGTAFSLAFGLRERYERQRAEAAEGIAVEAKDDLEQALARSLVRPLNPMGGDTLSEPEVEALWELAQKPGDRFWVRFLEEATRNEITAAQFSARAEPALIAAIGLNLERHSRAELFLAQRLADPNLSQRQQWDLSNAASVLGELQPSSERMIVDTLLKWTALNEKPVPESDVANQLVKYAKRLSPDEGARVLTQALEKETDGYARQRVAQGLAAVAERMKPAAADRICGEAARLLTQTLEKERDANARHWLTQGLADVAMRMEVAAAAQLLTQALEKETDALEKETDANARQMLTQGLAAVAGRMEPAAAARLLTQMLEKETNASARKALAYGLAAVAVRMEPGAAARICGEAARLLTKKLEKETDATNAREWLAEALAALAGQMEPAAAASLLTQSLGKETDWSELTNRPGHQSTGETLAHGLAAVAARMEPGVAASICSEAARLLTQKLEKETNASARKALAEGLAALALQMEPAAAVRLLTKALEEEKNTHTRRALAEGLAAVATRIESGVAALICGEAATLLTQKLEKETDGNVKAGLTEALAAMAARMEEGAAAQLLTQALEKEMDARPRQTLGQGLAAVAARMEPAAAARICAEAARLLTQKLDKETNAHERQILFEGLATVARQMDPASAADLLTQALEKGRVGYTWQYLAEGLAVVASKLNQAEANDLCNREIRKLYLRLEQADNWERKPLELAVVSLIQQLPPTLAAQKSTEMARRHCSGGDVNFSNKFPPEDRTLALDAFLTNTSRSEVNVRAASVARAVGLAIQGGVPPLPALPTASEPLPCRLSTQDLVELLKMPTCFGKARQVVLKHLGNRYGRRFANHWEFVRFAKEQQLDLDFTTPPKRPSRP